MKSRRDLCMQILANLQFYVPGQSVNAEEMAKVDAIIDPMFDELSGLGIYGTGLDIGRPGPTGGEIEPAAFLALADYGAYAAAPSFNLGNDAKLKAMAVQAEDRLRTLLRPSPARRTLKIEPGLMRR